MAANASTIALQTYEVLQARATVIPHNFVFSPTSCCAVAAFVWAAYDHALTLRDEVVLVWRQQLRLAAFLFFLIRYLGLLLLGTVMVIFLSLGSSDSKGDFQAGIFWTFTPITQFAVFWTVEVILQTRIYALYGSRRLAIINGIMFAIEIGVMLVLWLFRPAVNCVNECASLVPFYWLPGVAFELWLAALAVRKLKFKTSGSGDVFTVVVQDSVLYFALIAAVMIAHFVLAFFSLDAFALSFVTAGQTIGGSRLVLHLRKAYYERELPSSGQSIIVSSGENPLLSAPRPQAQAARGFVRTMIDDSFYGPTVLARNLNRVALVPL